MINRLKIIFGFAFCELRRKPKETVITVSFMTAVLVSLIMLLMFSEAQWRGEVMPEIPENYHFSIQSLSEGEKQWIRQQDFTQVTYDTDNGFRVRVTWEYAAKAVQCCRVIFDEFDLWQRAPYKERYDLIYQASYSQLKLKWMGATEKSGYTLEQMSNINARDQVLEIPYNRHFCLLTGTNYIVRPDNLILLMMFALFLGMAVTLLYSERYRSDMTRYGTLRAIGLTECEITLVFICNVVLTSLASLLPSALLSVAVVKLYNLISAGFEQDTAFTLLTYVPISNIILSYLALLIAVVLGAFAVCKINSGKLIIELLQRRSNFNVSYVEKTSDKFENATDSKIYSKLYASRTKKSMIANSLITVIMVPLPVYYIWLCIDLARTPGHSTLMLLYFIFQALMITATSFAVIIMASVFRMRTRRRELSVLRAIGMNLSEIFYTIRSGELRLAAVSALLSGLFLAAVYVLMDISLSSMGNYQIVYTLMALALGTALSPVTCVFLILPQLAGIALGMKSISGDNITDSIREVD